MESGDAGVSVGCLPYSLCALSLGVLLGRGRSRPAHVVGGLAVGVGWLRMAREPSRPSRALTPLPQASGSHSGSAGSVLWGKAGEHPAGL